MLKDQVSDVINMFRLLLLLKFIIVKESDINIILHIISGFSVRENLVKIQIVSKPVIILSYFSKFYESFYRYLWI